MKRFNFLKSITNEGNNKQPNSVEQKSLSITNIFTNKKFQNEKAYRNFCLNKHFKQKINVIFLDIDGVIYSGSTYDKEHRKRLNTGSIDQIKLDPVITQAISGPLLETLNKYDLSAALGFSQAAVKNVSNLCEKYDAKLVISSAWRESNSLEQMKALFSIWRDLAKHIIDCTPILHKSRGLEIESWLLKRSRQINSFIILDDATFDLHERFNDRFIFCEKLFSDLQLYQDAAKMLSQPISYETSAAVRSWQALEQSLKSKTEFGIDLYKMSTLRIHFMWNTKTLVNNLFSLLQVNSQITHLSFHDMYMDEISYSNKKELNEEFLSKLVFLLQNSAMKLKFLDLSGNSLGNIELLLKAIDGDKLHIPHICLNANPLENQQALARWIKTFSRSLRLDLDLSGSKSGRYELDNNVIEALIASKNVIIHTKPDILPFRMNSNQIDALIAAGKLIMSSNPASIQSYLLK